MSTTLRTHGRKGAVGLAALAGLWGVAEVQPMELTVEVPGAYDVEIRAQGESRLVQSGSPRAETFRVDTWLSRVDGFFASHQLFGKRVWTIPGLHHFYRKRVVFSLEDVAGRSTLSPGIPEDDAVDGANDRDGVLTVLQFAAPDTLPAHRAPAHPWSDTTSHCRTLHPKTFVSATTGHPFRITDLHEAGNARGSNLEDFWDWSGHALKFGLVWANARWAFEVHRGSNVVQEDSLMYLDWTKAKMIATVGGTRTAPRLENRYSGDGWVNIGDCIWPN